MTQMTTKKYKTIIDDQITTLDHLLDLLRALNIIPDYHLVYRKYYDTVMSYKIDRYISNEWTCFYDIERLIIGDYCA